MESESIVEKNIKKIKNNDSDIIDAAAKMFAEIIIFSLEEKESSRGNDSICKEK